MKSIDIVCDICGKKRGRPNVHTLCAIKRKALHREETARRARSSHTYANPRKLAEFIEEQCS